MNSITPNKRPATNEDTCGPYFPDPFCDADRMDLVEVHPGLVATARGTPIVIEGRLIDIDGNLGNGAVLEFWQPNDRGIYRTPAHADHPDLDPWFDGYARCRSKDGKFSLRTIKPGALADRAPNVTLTIFSDGISRLVTQIFLEGEAANASDPLLTSLPEPLRSRLIAKSTGANDRGEQVFSIDVVMAGNNETPFFDDLES
jgi:protocatechuate 3,4-dioxygenase beta subunit